MPYQIQFKPTAARDFKKLSREIQKRLIPKINSLGHNPFPSGVETLKGLEGVFRIRVGDYRILYKVEHKIVTILILRIGHRREIYRF